MTHPAAPVRHGQRLLDAFLRKPSGTPLTPLVPPRPRITTVAATPPSARRSPRRTWSSDDLAQARALVAAGHSNAALSTRFGCTRAAVATWLSAHGIRRERAVLSTIRCGVRPT